MREASELFAEVADIDRVIRVLELAPRDIDATSYFTSEIHGVRLALEPYMCMAAAEIGPLPGLLGSIEDTKSVIEQKDDAWQTPENYIVAWRFHFWVALSSRNLLLVRHYKTIVESNAWALAIGEHWPIGLQRQAHEDHYAIGQAIIARQPEAAFSLCSRHLGGMQVKVVRYGIA